MLRYIYLEPRLIGTPAPRRVFFHRWLRMIASSRRSLRFSSCAISNFVLQSTQTEIEVLGSLQ